MIRSSKHTLKFANPGKQRVLSQFVAEYKELVRKFVNIIWNNYRNDPPSLLDNWICQSISSDVNNDSNIRQCAAKQACSMVRAVVAKHNKRLWKLKQLQKEGKDTRYLQRKIDTTKLTKPDANNINVELDSRFVTFKEGKHFDIFIQIYQIGNKRKIRLPIKHTKVSRKWLKKGKFKGSIRINEREITLYFEIQRKQNKGTRKLGADQGQTTCLTLSDGQVTVKNEHGHDLNTIQDRLTRRKKGSKGFIRSQEHRKNYINWSINQLDFSHVKELGFEKVKNLKKGRKTTRKLSHWTYPLIKMKLIMVSENEGFKITEQDNKFRSQRCSQCGWTQRSNRKGKTFKCLHCEFYADSDLNAASNHEIELPDLPWEVWHNHENIKGFFWL